MIGFPSIGTSRTVTDASHEGASGVASKSRPNVHAPGDPYHTLHDDSQGVGPLGPEIVVEPPKHEAKLANRRWRTSTATVPWTVDGAPTKVAPGAKSADVKPTARPRTASTMVAVAGPTSETTVEVVRPGAATRARYRPGSSCVPLCTLALAAGAVTTTSPVAT